MGTVGTGAAAAAGWAPIGRETDYEDDDGPASGEADVDGYLDAVEAGLEALLSSDRGRRHEHLAAEPEEALLALLGHPPDARDCWTHLARDLRATMMQQAGLCSGRC